MNLTNGAEHSDGNGIIIDDFRNTQQNKAPYPYKTLVENNVCYFNGGKGIHVFFSDNVTVRNNTCYFNNRDPKNPATWRGELSNVNANNTVWVNNIGYADIKVNAYNRAILDGSCCGQTNSNVIWMRNLSFNGTPGSASVTQSPYNATITSAAPYANLLGVDPLFVSAGQGMTNPDLHLQSASKAVIRPSPTTGSAPSTVMAILVALGPPPISVPVRSKVKRCCGADEPCPSSGSAYMFFLETGCSKLEE